MENFLCPILHDSYKNQFSTKHRKRLHNLFRYFHLHCRWWYLSPIYLNPTRRYVPCWMQWRSWTCTLDCGLETFLFIIFLITLDEIAVYFSSQDVLDIRIFYLMTEGKQEGKRHWFFRTGNCTPVWRNGRHQCHMKHHWHCSFFQHSNSFQLKKAIIKITEIMPILESSQRVMKKDIQSYSVEFS